MRFGIAKDRWTTLFGVLVLWVAGTTVLSTGPFFSDLAPAWAADQNTPPLTKIVVKGAKTPPTDTKTPSAEEKTSSAEDMTPSTTAKTPTAEEKTPTLGEKSPSADEKTTGVTENASNKKIPDKKGAADKGAGQKTIQEKKIVEKKDVANDDREILDDEKIIDAERNVGDKGGANNGPAPEASFLTWLCQSLGTRYIVIFLIITFNAMALIVMILFGMRRKYICPDDLAAAFEVKLNEKKYQEAYELAKADHSFLGKVLAAGMSKLSDGYEESLRSMQEVGEEQNMRLEQRNSYIALIAQIGPMFGLLGTVDGMVMAFDVIAHSNVTPKPSELAQGIGTALVTTVVGLWIAIPCIAFFHIVRNRLSRQVGEVGAVSGNLMKRFSGIQIATKKIEK
jgi:biopolymer transport protein ExbB